MRASPRTAAATAAVTAAVTAALVAASALLAACSSGGERPVTSEEAQRLALARLSVYDERFVDLDARVPVDGQTLHLQGVADLQDHAAYALVTTQDEPPRHALLQWTLQDKAVRETTATTLPAAPPADGWQTAALVPTDQLDSALALVLNLAADRPDNPLLLQQGGARWLGSDEVDGTPVDVFLGPGADATTDERLRWFVDEDGTLLRVDADTGAEDHLVVDLRPSRASAVPLVDALAG